MAESRQNSDCLFLFCRRSVIHRCQSTSFCLGRHASSYVLITIIIIIVFAPFCCCCLLLMMVAEHDWWGFFLFRCQSRAHTADNATTGNNHMQGVAALSSMPSLWLIGMSSGGGGVRSLLTSSPLLALGLSLPSSSSSLMPLPPTLLEEWRAATREGGRGLGGIIMG